jgi:hypothetical protein
MRPVGASTWVAAVGAFSLALSCGAGRIRAAGFGRPSSFAPACAGATVISAADSSGMTHASEVMRSPSGWTATLAKGTMRFEGAREDGYDRDDGSLSDFCRWAREAEGARAAREVDGVCILGVDCGEWGAWVEAVEPGTPPTRYAIAGGRPKWLLPVGADGRSLVVIEGIYSQFQSVGALLRLARTDEGKWCRAQVVALGGDPVGWHVDEAGAFTLLLSDPLRRFFVVRVGDDGHAVPVE